MATGPFCFPALFPMHYLPLDYMLLAHLMGNELGFIDISIFWSESIPVANGRTLRSHLKQQLKIDCFSFLETNVTTDEIGHFNSTTTAPNALSQTISHE